jgi:hypothetical protein
MRRGKTLSTVVSCWSIPRRNPMNTFSLASSGRSDIYVTTNRNHQSLRRSSPEDRAHQGLFHVRNTPIPRYITHNSRRQTENVYPSQPIPQTASNQAWTMGAPQGQFLYQPENFGNEFSVLTCGSKPYLVYWHLTTAFTNRDFLETLDERSFFTAPPSTVAPSMMSSAPYGNSGTTNIENTFIADAGGMSSMAPPQNQLAQTAKEEPVPNVIPTATKQERFLLTAADQEPGSRDERLNRVIRSKFEAGLLKPYNYVKGYTRLSRWMDRK